MLTLAGVPQRVVMELMRHSDMRLTAKTYTDAGMLPVDATITKLPSLNGAVIPAPQPPFRPISHSISSPLSSNPEAARPPLLNNEDAEQPNSKQAWGW
jgi:hypothetical protein